MTRFMRKSLLVSEHLYTRVGGQKGLTRSPCDLNILIRRQRISLQPHTFTTPSPRRHLPHLNHSLLFSPSPSCRHLSSLSRGGGGSGRNGGEGGGGERDGDDVFKDKEEGNHKAVRSSSSLFWKCRNTWRRAGVNTSWCLLGCSIGEFGTLGAYQVAGIDPLSPFSMILLALPLINGLVTSVALETYILMRPTRTIPTSTGSSSDQVSSSPRHCNSSSSSSLSSSSLPSSSPTNGKDDDNKNNDDDDGGRMGFRDALRTALGMSFVSMVAMELAMEGTDFLLTGGMTVQIWAIPPVLFAGWLTPLPYNYWRLRKFGKACH